MQATRLWVLAGLAALGSSLLVACGDDEVGHTPGAAGAAAGESSEQPIGGQATGGTKFMVGGTSGIAASTSGGGGTSSVTAAGGVAGSDEMNTTGGAGGALTSLEGEQLEVCGRLTMLVPHATAVTRAYVAAVYADCGVQWVVPLKVARADFENDLLTWSYDFWGCPGTPPVDSFGLVYGTPALTAGDAAALIAHYLAVAQTELELSPPESDAMKSALERLATTAITDPSTELSQSRCATGAGGAAGAAGAGGAAASVGGAGEATGGAP